MKKLIAFLVLFLTIPTPVAKAEPEYTFYTVVNQEGAALCRIGYDVFVGDEYISGDNQLYRVVSVDDGNQTAVAEHLGEEPFGQAAYSSLNETLAEVSAGSKNKLVALYCTHSDESYIPTDGKSASEGRGGIYDVANAFAAALNQRGIETIVDETQHHPHDAGAYRRSQSTAAQLAKKMPAALIDVHRDGVPIEEYQGEVKGEPTSMVRLLVGRANPNSGTNREFAKQLKASADEIHPGLIKDIFIGKGNYNQELMPHSILFEFGTYTIEKEMAVKAAEYMADVIQAAVFGEAPGYTPETNRSSAPGAAVSSPSPTQKASPEQQGAQKPAVDNTKGSGSGIAWVVALFAVGLVTVGLIAGGKSGLWGRLKRTASEMTGGAVGRKPKDDDRLS